METQTLIRFDRLASVLERYGEAMHEEYKTQLAAHGRNASGTLANTVRHIIQRGTKAYAVDLSLADYWYYVEHGRKAGKWPPLNKILEWVRVKPVVPHPMDNGKLPTERSLAFMIARKIGNEGTRGTPALDTASQNMFDRFMSDINNAMRDDIADAVDSVLLTFSRK